MPSKLDLIDAIYDPTTTHYQIQKDLEERRLLIKQIEETTNQQRAVEQSMQTARRKAAEDMLRAETLMKEASELQATAQQQFEAVQIEAANNRDFKRELDERDQALNHREQLIDLKQTTLDKALEKIRTLVT
jgi:hypothetical protein